MNVFWWIVCVRVTVLMAAWEISPRSDPALLRLPWPSCSLILSWTGSARAQQEMALRASAWLLFKSPPISLFRLLSGSADKGHTRPSCCFEFRKRLCKIGFKCEFELNWSQHTGSWIGIIQRCRWCMLGNGVIFHLFSILLCTNSDCSYFRNWISFYKAFPVQLQCWKQSSVEDGETKRLTVHLLIIFHCQACYQLSFNSRPVWRFCVWWAACVPESLSQFMVLY